MEAPAHPGIRSQAYGQYGLNPIEQHQEQHRGPKISSLKIPPQLPITLLEVMLLYCCWFNARSRTIGVHAA